MPLSSSRMALPIARTGLAGVFLRSWASSISVPTQRLKRGGLEAATVPRRQEARPYRELVKRPVRAVVRARGASRAGAAFPVRPAHFCDKACQHAKCVHALACDCAGVSVISGEAVPEGTMYVTSSRRGPVFVNGPTVMRREGGRLVVARYCAAHGPEGGAPGRGPGFALGAGRMAA